MGGMGIFDGTGLVFNGAVGMVEPWSAARSPGVVIPDLGSMPKGVTKLLIGGRAGGQGAVMTYRSENRTSSLDFAPRRRFLPGSLPRCPFRAQFGYPDHPLFERTRVAKQHKALTVLGWILTALIFAMLAFSATMKFKAPPEVADMFTGKFGYPKETLTPIAVTEVACALLFLFPRTAMLERCSSRATWVGPSRRTCALTILSSRPRSWALACGSRSSFESLVFGRCCRGCPFVAVARLATPNSGNKTQVKCERLYPASYV
jgi:hypothetical protein